MSSEDYLAHLETSSVGETELFSILENFHIISIPQPILINDNLTPTGLLAASDFLSTPAGADPRIQQSPCNRGWRFYGIVACFCVVNLVYALNASILAVALPTIATDLEGTAIQAFWCSTSFLLCSTVFQPTWASFSDFINRKSMVLTSLFLFTAGTIMASTARNITWLLIGRCFQGIGGGGLVCLTHVVITDMVTLRERGKWLALISLQWAVGTMAGPLLGGLFAETTTWRWIFWINIPFCGISAIGFLVCLSLRHDGSIWIRLLSFDWLGSFLFVTSTTSFLIPVTWGGIMYSWLSWRTLVPLLIGISGLICFMLYSSYISRNPLIRRSLFFSSTANVAYFGSIIHGIISWSLLYYMPLYFEVAKSYSPITSSTALLPFTFTMAPTATTASLVIYKTGKYRPSLWAGWILLVFGAVLLVYLQQSTNTTTWILLLLLPGAGLGILFSAQRFAAQAPASNNDLSLAGAMPSFFRALGQTLGVSFSGVIFQNAFKSQLQNTAYASFANEWSRNARSFVTVLKAWSDTGEEGAMKQIVVLAYIEGLKMVWTAMWVVGGVGLFCSIFWTEEISLERTM